MQDLQKIKNVLETLPLSYYLKRGEVKAVLSETAIRSTYNYRSVRDTLPKFLRNMVELNYGFEEGVISSTRGKTQVYIINEPNRNIREDILRLILT